jgi:hypothetical protein
MVAAVLLAASQPLYDVVVLTTDLPWSQAYAIFRGVAYGKKNPRYNQENSDRPVAWMGSGFWKDLDMTGLTFAWVTAASAGGSVGYGSSGNDRGIAVWWPPGGGRPVNLNPGYGFGSIAFAVNSRHQYGWVADDLRTYPARWSGTRDSWLNLTPRGYAGGQVNGADEEVAVGAIGRRIYSVDTDYRACLWRDTPESCVVLHPREWRRSEALGAGGGQQVGYGERFWGPNQQFKPTEALLWRGTPESLVRLHPENTPGWSVAYATNGVHQVGAIAPRRGPYRACRWSGGPKTRIDLHRYVHQRLGPLAEASYARAIDEDGTIVGDAYMWVPGTGYKYLAVMWVPRRP